VIQEGNCGTVVDRDGNYQLKPGGPREVYKVDLSCYRVFGVKRASAICLAGAADLEASLDKSTTYLQIITRGLPFGGKGQGSVNLKKRKKELAIRHVNDNARKEKDGPRPCRGQRSARVRQRRLMA